MKLHLGCGCRNFGADWIHIDGGDYDHLDYKDITNLEFSNNSVDLVYASHVLEYFDRDEAPSLLQEWYRVLKPQGILRIAVPDFHALSFLYQQNKVKLKDILGPLYGKMKMGDHHIYHKTVYDRDTLGKALLDAGFKQHELYSWKETEHANFDDHSQAHIPHMHKEHGCLVSLNMEGLK
tara:strand:- start:9543 stop:10079 length:537 start_codon:yes stop_codon:yes gene_type:complete